MDRVKWWAATVAQMTSTLAVALAVNGVLRWRGLFGEDATRAQWWVDFGLQCAVMGLLGYAAASASCAWRGRAMRKRIDLEIKKLSRARELDPRVTSLSDYRRLIARSNELTARLQAATVELEAMRDP